MYSAIIATCTDIMQKTAAEFLADCRILKCHNVVVQKATAVL